MQPKTMWTMKKSNALVVRVKKILTILKSEEKCSLSIIASIHSESRCYTKLRLKFHPKLVYSDIS
jgi:hypothetical protein